MGYSGKCLFPWSDIFQIECRVYGCFSHRPINWLIFLLPKMHTLTLMSTVALLSPINIYLYILFVLCCILYTIHFQGHDLCYKCSRYTWNMESCYYPFWKHSYSVLANYTLLKMLNVFSWGVVAELSCPLEAPCTAPFTKSRSYLSYILTIFIYITYEAYQSLMHSISHPHTVLIYVGILPSIQYIYTEAGGYSFPLSHLNNQELLDNLMYSIRNTSIMLSWKVTIMQPNFAKFWFLGWNSY